MKKITKPNQRILNIICKILKLDEKKISFDDFDMTKIPQWDSVSHVELISSLEDEYKIEFNSKEIPLLTNIKNIEEIIAKKTK